MIDWDVVSKLIEQTEGQGLRESLNDLYWLQDKSPREIANMTQGEVISSASIRSKMRDLGLPLKGRGGANNRKKEG